MRKERYSESRHGISAGIIVCLLCALAFSPSREAFASSQNAVSPSNTSHSTPGARRLLAAKPEGGKKSSTAAKAKDNGEVFATAPLAPITAEEAINIKLYKTVSPAVVNVISSRVTPEMIMQGVAPPTDTGSGSIISPDGYILTNFHVVNNASIVRVTLYDGTSYMATVVGADPQNDLVVLKIDAGKRQLSTVRFGDSSKLEVGRRIYAIGNPLGLNFTMTSGIISSVGRTLKTEAGHTIKGIIQTDAAINPGNSGGPLLDSQGNMIGVTTAIVGKLSAGLGFAIPINVVKIIVPQLIVHGKIVRPDTGIVQVRVVQVAGNPVLNAGLQILTLDPAGPAAQAGLKGPSIRQGQSGLLTYTMVDNSTADIIVGIDSQRVASVDDLLSYLENKKPGQVVTLNVLRQGQREVTRIPVKLTETKAQPNS